MHYSNTTEADQDRTSRSALSSFSVGAAPDLLLSVIQPGVKPGSGKLPISADPGEILA